MVPSMYHNTSSTLNMTCNKVFDKGPTIMSLSHTKSCLIHGIHSCVYIYIYISIIQNKIHKIHIRNSK